MLVPIGVYSSLPGMGKTTVARYLSHQHGYEVISFAAPIKDMARTLLRHTGMPDSEIEDYIFNPEIKNTKIIPGLGVTMRHILQTLGTDWGRKEVHKDIWVNMALQRSANRTHGGIIVDDMRFPNEFARMQEAGIVIRVIREVEDYGNAHTSESRLDDMSFDYVIHNDGDISDLYAQLDKMFPENYLKKVNYAFDR